MIWRPLLALAIALTATTSRGADLSIDASADPLLPRILVDIPAGVAAADVRVRLVRLDEKTGQPGPAVFGSVATANGQTFFQPEFRLTAGGQYRATLTLPGRPPVSIDYAAPLTPDDKPATVERVYPTADKLPANLLKFYVYFSRPMRQTDRIFDRMQILDEKGQPVHDPWRRFQQWSEDGKRLTLWIHPGRVKRGVNLREEFGPVLVPGKRFTLRLETTLEDLAGRPMSAAFEKVFTATAEDRTTIDMSAWKLFPVAAGTRDALRLVFPKPLDHALLPRLLSVRDPAGNAVEGTIAVGDAETTWTFTPARRWESQAYRVAVDDLMEDLAGNTPVRVFDTDMSAATTRPASQSRKFTPSEK